MFGGFLEFWGGLTHFNDGESCERPRKFKILGYWGAGDHPRPYRNDMSYSTCKNLTVVNPMGPTTGSTTWFEKGGKASAPLSMPESGAGRIKHSNFPEGTTNPNNEGRRPLYRISLAKE